MKQTELTDQMHESIKSIQANITKSRHYGASHNEAEEYSLNVRVQVDSNWYNKTKKKQDPVKCFIVGLKNLVYAATQVDTSCPLVGGQKDRAKNGLKTIHFQFFLSKSQAETLGVDVSKWSIYHEVDLVPKRDNVIYVDFKRKRRISA